MCAVCSCLRAFVFRYQCPPEGTLDDLRSYIDRLPRNETPEAFGLHPNANIEYVVAATL